MRNELLRIVPLQERITNRPLRILFVMHMPWSRELGGPRVSVEIADNFQRLGHTVDKYDINDAFRKRSKFSSYFEGALFPRRAAQYVKANAHRYDVIQAEQGNLPFTKQELNFLGVIVARSNGLVHFYERYEQEAKQRARNSGQRHGSFIGNLLRTLGYRMANHLSCVERSFEVADAILTINRDEFNFVVDSLGHGNKTFLWPPGMSGERFAEFSINNISLAARLQNKQICFVGTWGERKGARDFPAIVRSVREQIPDAQFLLLGTATSQNDVRRCFHVMDRAAVTVIPFYRPADLPILLKNATVGVFPSYIEGFPVGLLEKLAAGIPAIAYDVPGSREILRLFNGSMMVSAGDTTAMAARLLEILTLSLSSYTSLSNEAQQIAERFSWNDTATLLLSFFETKLQELGQ